MHRRRWPTKCPECGTEIGDHVAFCPTCGRQVRAAPHRSEYVAPVHLAAARKTGEKRDLALLISLVVVLVVVMPLVLAMILYIGIIGFGGTEVEPVTTDLTRTAEAGGYRFTFGLFTSRTEWEDIDIVLSGGSSSVFWSPATSALEGSSPTTFEFAPISLDSMTVYCNVTDLHGNGWVGEGDYFTIETGGEHTFVSGVDYTVLIIHEPTGVISASDSFSA